MAEPLTQTTLSGVILRSSDAARSSGGWGFLLGSVALSSTAQILLKAGAVVGTESGGMVSKGVSLFTQPAVIVGLMLYGLGTLLWLKCLSRLDLGLAYLVSALQYVVVFAAARFGETLSPTRCLGLAVIVVGIVIVSRPRNS